MTETPAPTGAAKALRIFGWLGFAFMLLMNLSLLSVPRGDREPAEGGEELTYTISLAVVSLIILGIIAAIRQLAVVRGIRRGKLRPWETWGAFVGVSLLGLCTFLATSLSTYGLILNYLFDARGVQLVFAAFSFLALFACSPWTLRTKPEEESETG